MIRTRRFMGLEFEFSLPSLEDVQAAKEDAEAAKQPEQLGLFLAARCGIDLRGLTCRGVPLGFPPDVAERLLFIRRAPLQVTRQMAQAIQGEADVDPEEERFCSDSEQP